MIRAVLAVAAAVALLGAAAPTMADARVQTTEDRLSTQGDRLAAVAADLVTASAPVAEPALAGRRTVEVRVPSGFAAAPVEGAMIGCPDAPAGEVESRTDRNRGSDCDAVLSYRIGGEPRRSVSIPGVALRTPSGPVVLSDGTTRLTLRHVRLDDEPVVTVERARETPTADPEFT